MENTQCPHRLAGECGEGAVQRVDRIETEAVKARAKGLNGSLGIAKKHLLVVSQGGAERGADIQPLTDWRSIIVQCPPDRVDLIRPMYGA
jgi:hypothetical protein